MMRCRPVHALLSGTLSAAFNAVAGIPIAFMDRIMDKAVTSFLTR
jgi:hypothetical protein